MKLSKVLLLLLAVPSSALLADSLTNDGAIEVLSSNADEIAIVARMAESCTESIDDGLFNLAWDRCSRFTPAFAEVYKKNRPALDYSFYGHEGGIESFCGQSDELLSICANVGIMMDGYQKAMRASELGAFDN